MGSLASSGVAFSIFSEEEIGRATDGFAEARVLGAEATASCTGASSPTAPPWR